MRKLFLILWLLTTTKIFASIQEAEYFIDVDPGIGNGVAIPFSPDSLVEINFVADLTGLTDGIHILFVRARSDSGWSQINAQPFIKNQNSADAIVSGIEYFIDSDSLGYGNGVIVPTTPDSLIEKDILIPLSGLSPGFHNLFFRARTGNGVWSCTQSRPFNVGIDPVAAGNIIYSEYFFDSDPGEGLGTAVPITPDSIVNKEFIADLSSISPGIHILTTRGKDQYGAWTHTFSIPVIVGPDQQAASNIILAEYFIDVDPGEGNGSSIPVLNDSIIDTNFVAELSALTPGIHILYARAKDANGNWSITHSRPFIAGGDQLGSPDIIKIEEFIDIDPGFGNANLITIPSDSILELDYLVDLDSISPGIHILSIRALDSDGAWGHSFNKLFIRNSGTLLSLVESAEYYFDQDPGVGNGIPITFGPDTIIDVLSNADLNGLSVGIHTINLRAKTQNKAWSHINSRPFIFNGSGGSNPIELVEFSLDSFGSYGGGSILLNPNDTLVDSLLIASIAGLDLGSHQIMLRARNSDKVWSHVFYNTFCVSPGAFFSADSGCIGVPVAFQNLSTGTDSLTNFLWDLNGDNLTDTITATNFNFTFDSAGTFNSRLITFNDSSCRDTMNFEVVIHEPLQALITSPDQDLSFCSGDSILLDAGITGNNYLWSVGDTTQQIMVGTTSTISVNIMDENGCFSLDTISVQKLNLPIIFSGNDLLDCKGKTVVLNAAGGINYLWLPDSTQSDSLIHIIQNGNYQVFLIGTDSAGCSNMDTINITSYSLPVADFSADVTSGCAPLNVSFSNLSTNSVTQNWDFGNGNTSGLANPQSSFNSGIYTVKLIAGSSEGCLDSVVKSNYINALALPAINGLIGVPVTSGRADLYFADSVGVLAPMATDQFSAGTFYLGSVAPGNYKLMVTPDSNLFPNHIREYYNNGFIWDSAIVISLACGETDTVSMTMESLQGLSGDGVISGTLYYGPSKTYMGDPIPGIDITLEQNPGGIVAVTKTDSLGYYEFNNVPVGNYQLLVNIPGLGMDSSYVIKITPADTTHPNLNYFVGDSSIYIEEVGTNRIEHAGNSMEIHVYPNPSNNLIWLEGIDYNRIENISVSDLSGKSTKVLNKAYAGKITYCDISHFSSGIYFLHVESSTGRYIFKFVKI